MKKILIILSIIAVVAVAALFGYKVYHGSQLRDGFGRGAGDGQSGRISNGEGGIPQSGDPCGGTGGNGQIISVGNNTINVKVTHGKNNGSKQVVNLTAETSIRTSTGAAVLSDLKTGDRVTLVGGFKSDGSFTANTVVVCNIN